MPRRDGNIYHRGMELAKIAKSIMPEPAWVRKIKRELGLVDEARRKSERTRKRRALKR